MKDNLIIVLVDDSASDRVLFREVLRLVDQSSELIAVEDGKTALQFLEHIETLPDYIFLDVNMPGINGTDTLRLMKKMERAKHIPVIMYSTVHPTTYQETAMFLGAEKCLAKSIDFFETCEEIASVIQEESKEIHHENY